MRVRGDHVATPPKFACVVAMDAKRGIGKRGNLPWPALPGDMRHFAHLTTQAPSGARNVVIMGRKTWDSLPAKYQPLPRRHNLVISRQALDLPAGATVATSLPDALRAATALPNAGDVFVIGGGQIYAAAVTHPQCALVYLTTVAGDFDCDTHLVALAAFAPDPTWPVQHHRDGTVAYTIERLRRRDAM